MLHLLSLLYYHAFGTLLPLLGCANIAHLPQHLLVLYTERSFLRRVYQEMYHITDNIKLGSFTFIFVRLSNIIYLHVLPIMSIHCKS